MITAYRATWASGIQTLEIEPPPVRHSQLRDRELLRIEIPDDTMLDERPIGRWYLYSPARDDESHPGESGYYYLEQAVAEGWARIVFDGRNGPVN